MSIKKIEAGIHNLGRFVGKAAVAGFALFIMSGASDRAEAAVVTTFGDQAAFVAALDGGSTLVDVSASIGANLVQLSAITPGATFFGPNTSVRSDALIPHGQGFFGTTNQHVGLNFETTVNGVGVTSNLFDGGRIQAYSGLNGTGTLLGEHGFGGNTVASLFGGLITDQPILSVVYTCDFNFDLACGVIDPVFGLSTSALSSDPVPLPAGAFLFMAGLGALGVARRAKAAAA